MDQEAFNLDDAVALLAQTPASLSALFAGVPERWVRATHGDDTWSPYDVIDHLIQGERTNWMVRSRHILDDKQRPFDPFDRMAAVTERQGKTIAELLATFADLRRANVAALVGMHLTSADLSRTGQHPEFGAVRLGQLLATWVVHDLNHMGQIVQTLAQVYTDAVGPWRAYLAILQEREGPSA
jgi:uncharacterized damage-inducible protein DinB